MSSHYFIFSQEVFKGVSLKTSCILAHGKLEEVLENDHLFVNVDPQDEGDHRALLDQKQEIGFTLWYTRTGRKRGIAFLLSDKKAEQFAQDCLQERKEML